MGEILVKANVQPYCVQKDVSEVPHSVSIIDSVLVRISLEPNLERVVSDAIAKKTENSSNEVDV